MLCVCVHLFKHDWLLSIMTNVKVEKVDLGVSCETMPQILDFLYYFGIYFRTETCFYSNVVEKVVLKGKDDMTRIEIYESCPLNYGKMPSRVVEVIEPPSFIRSWNNPQTKIHDFITGAQLVEALRKVKVVVNTDIEHTGPVFRPDYQTVTRASFAMELQCLETKISRLL